MYYWFLLPLYYILGLAYVILKTLLLNPPWCGRLQSSIAFEIDTKFAGGTPEERMEFANKWYSTERRKERFQAISSRFTYLPHRRIWMEKFAFFTCMALPAQATAAVFDEQAQQWHVRITWWHPHALNGHVIIGENENRDGWLISGDIRCWPCLVWLYKWMTVRVLEMYADQMGEIE